MAKPRVQTGQKPPEEQKPVPEAVVDSMGDGIPQQGDEAQAVKKPVDKDGHRIGANSGRRLHTPPEELSRIVKPGSCFVGADGTRFFGLDEVPETCDITGHEHKFMRKDLAKVALSDRSMAGAGRGRMRTK